MELIEDILLWEGYDVVTCQNCEEAIEIVRLQAPALVIADICLPGKSGAMLLEDIRTFNGSTPFIGISGHTQDDPDVKRLLQAGADAFFSKPFQIPEMVRTINSILALR